MVMDHVKSFGLMRCRIFADSDEEILVRWYPARPDAKVFPGWHAFGHPAWEDAEGRDQFVGPGMILEGQEWRGSTYPAPPGQHWHGELDWFEHGLPSRPVETPASLCGVPLVVSVGGVEVGGTSAVAAPSVTACGNCTAGAFPIYIVRVRGVVPVSPGAPDVNGDWPVTWQSACTWQGPRVLLFGAAELFWQFVIGNPRKRTQLRPVPGTGSVAIYDTNDPWNCWTHLPQTFTAGDAAWDWSAATVEVFPFAE